MRLLLDVHHSPRAAEQLRRCGIDTVAAAGDRGLARLPDRDLLQAATAAGRAVVTEDVRDVNYLAQEWVRARRDHAGIVFTSRRRFYRGSRAYPQDLVDALVAFAGRHELPDDARNWVRWLA
ncbi:MAG TPA: DUF5615 family PIN-like protein [Acidimicrobiales bacterium]|nr:DUF5615 family PIN-like protein [Acidimicrobiales bacterium]